MPEHWPTSPWPLSGRAPLIQGVPLVLALSTPETQQRAAARTAVRSALRDVLGTHLGVAPQDVPLCIEPGHRPRLATPDAPIGIGIAHEAGCSLLGLYPGGTLGVDLMHIAPLDDWEAVSEQYLGPECCHQLRHTPATQRPHAFAQAWTRHEARLKCLGEALTEWSPTVAARLSVCRTWPLALPARYAGSLAIAD